MEGPCPEPPFVAECVFGQTSQALRRSGAVEIREVATHTTDATMDELTGRQLVYGYQCEGIFAPASPAEAVALTDDGVYILEITVRASGERYTWLRLYMGDTEVGYIYQQGTLTLSARVSDQEIVACTVP